MRLSHLSVTSLNARHGWIAAAGCCLLAVAASSQTWAQSRIQLKWSAITTPAAHSFGTALSEPEPPIASASPIRVVVRSYETAALSAEINARITLLPQREGDRFKKGDIIVEFDCRKIVAEHDAALATFRVHQSVYENQQQLLRYKAAGTLAVNQALHELDKAKADVRGLEAKRTGCQITAPFDGRVTEKSAQVHEIAQPNQPILKIINEGKMELVMMVPSNLLSKVADGTRFRVKLDENGDLHDARIVQSTGLIDPVSQSARMIAELIDAPSTVIPGMSGTALFTNHQDTK
jgi:membrane fusion protein, multidrug efflux system